MKQKTFSMKIYINLAKQSKLNLKYPIYLKLTYNGDKVESRLPKTFDCSANELANWDSSIMQFRFKKQDDRNTDLKAIQLRYEMYLRDNKYALNHSLKELMAILLDNSALYKNWTVSSYCEYYINNRVKNNIKLKEGTKINYKKAVMHMDNFLEHKKLTHLPLQSFKHKEAQDFEIYMGDVAKNAPSSTSTNIVRLKSIFIEAINEELILKNPFSKLRLRYRGMSKTPSLTIYQVKAILENEKIKAEPRLMFYRDMFLFGCFTGLSVSNIISLSNTAIFPLNTDGLKLDTSRVKTSELIVQVLPKPAAKIYYRYNGTSKSQTVFPSFSADDFREKLKLIAVLADINVNLTTKLSRTTCNQMLVNVGSFDNIYKRAYMGWSNISSIESIYTTLVDDVLVRNTRNIDEYLLSQLGADLLEKI